MLFQAVSPSFLWGRGLLCNFDMKSPKWGFAHHLFPRCHRQYFLLLLFPMLFSLPSHVLFPLRRCYSFSAVSLYLRALSVHVPRFRATRSRIHIPRTSRVPSSSFPFFPVASLLFFQTCLLVPLLSSPLERSYC